MSNLKAGVFGMDLVMENFGHFPGYWDGRHTAGGGWAQPFFTRAVADQIMAANNRRYSAPDEAEYRVTYNEAVDAFICPSTDDIFQGVDVLIDGAIVRLYDFAGWCWDTVE